MKDKLSVVIPATSLVVILLCIAFQVHLFFGDKEDDAVPPTESAVTVEEQNPTPEPQPAEDTPTDEVVDITPEVDPEPVDDSVSALLDNGMSVEQIMEEKFGYVEDPNQPEPTVIEMEYPEGAEGNPEIYRTHTSHGVSFFDNTVPFFYDAERFVEDHLQDFTDENGNIYKTAEWSQKSKDETWVLDIDTESGDIISKEYQMGSYEISEEEFRTKFDLLDPTYAGPYMIDDAGNVVLK